MALYDGVALQRWFDCWCQFCMHVTGPTDGGPMDSNYRVPTRCSQACWQGVASALHDWLSGALSQEDAAALQIAEGDEADAMIDLSAA